jgi:predicted TIM-barrel fold metal-dependent hydrolase
MLRCAVDELGAERILFGSDYPFWHPAVERTRVDSAGLDRVSSRLILGENAQRLFDF